MLTRYSLALLVLTNVKNLGQLSLPSLRVGKLSVSK